MIPLVRLAALTLLLLLSASGARAQGVQGFCPSSYEPAVEIGATRYDVRLEDGCKLLVFSAGTAIAVTLPNPATTLPVGWKIGLKAAGVGTLTVTPLGGALIDLGANLIMTTGQGTQVYQDHTDFYSIGVSGGGGGGGVTNVDIVGGPCLTAIPNPILTTGIIELTVPAIVPCGGTGDTTLTAHGVMIGESRFPVGTTAAGDIGIPLIGQGPSADPIFGTAAVVGGGTGQTSYTDGQLLIGNSSGNTLTKATLTAGSGVSIVNGNGSITISSTGGAGVTSVAETVPGEFTISGSPITSSGTLAIGKATEIANTVWAGPTSGGAAQPTFRAAVCADLPGSGCPSEITMFWPGLPPNSQIVRIAQTVTKTCPVSFAGSVGIAKEAATASTVVNINQVVAGVPTGRGSLSWGGTSTVATPSSAAGMTLAPNDIVEFVFPASADATLGDIAITLKCVRA